MNVDFESATWARSHGSMPAAINRLIRRLDASFAALQRHQFDAPWRRARLQRGRA
jgi:hypothetical protein